MCKKKEILAPNSGARSIVLVERKKGCVFGWQVRTDRENDRTHCFIQAQQALDPVDQNAWVLVGSTLISCFEIL